VKFCEPAQVYFLHVWQPAQGAGLASA